MRKKTIREKRSTAWSKAILSVCLVMLLIFSQSNIIAFSATVKPDLSGKTDVRAVPNTVLPEKGKLQSVEAMSAKAIASAEITVFTDIMVPSMRQLTFDGTEELSELETYGKGFRFQGSLGQTVHIRMDSADFDSYLFLYDSNKSLLTLDDDGGGNRNARIIYTLPSNGDYYIVATQWFYPPDEPGFTGNATFSVGYVDNTLTYDTNGSASSSWSEMFEANLPVPITTVIPQAPAGNYLFRGWTAQKVDVADGANYSGTIYQPTGSITLTNNATLYALWAYCGGPTPLPFEVKSNLADSGTWSPYTGEKGFCYSFSLSTGQVLAVTMTTVNILPVLVLYNAEGEVVASYEGTSLSAWINYDVKTSGTYYLYATSDYLSPYIDGEFTLSAETSSNSATLIYDANGGFAAPPSVTVIANSEFYLSKETPLNNGYFFLGWSTSQSAVTATYGPGDQFNMVLPSLTLYAVWKAYTPVEQFPFSVSGSLSNGDGWSLNAAWMKGYSFYAPAGSIVVVTMKSPNSDSFLYLLDANSAVVAYNDDYGGNLDSRVSFTVQTGGTYYLQATTFSKQPSDFTLNISLETPRVITYDTQGGSPTPPQQEVAVGGYDYVSGEIPIRLGYTFLGWNTNPSGNGVYYEHNERLAIGGDMVLYAIWAQHVNTVATISSPSYTVAQITQTSPLLVQETSLSSRYAAYRVWLTAEQYTTIHMESNDFDSLLYLLDPNGQYITNDDDSGGNSNAYIEYFVPSDGWYYILTSQWQDSEGSYVLSVGTLPTLSAGSVVAGAGNTIEIPVMASGSPSLSSLKFDVAYESSALKLTDVTLPNGSGFSVLFVPNPGNEMISLSPKGTDSISPNGVLLTITFEISENAAVGNHLISLQNIKASDEKDSPIQFSAESGSVEVIRYGDANGDNLVNGFDVQALVLWINAGRPAGGIDEVSARITGVSGRPDGFDVQALVLWVNSGGDPNVGHPGPYAVTAQSTSGLVTPFSIAAASAEADLTIEVESKTASPGDTNVEVPIMITYNPGVSVISDLRIDLGAGLTLYYPQGEAAYAAGFATWPYIAGNRYQGEGEGMIPTMGRPTNLNIGNSHIVFNFQDTTEPFNSLETGMLVTLRLTVDAAASGNIPITISGGLYDSIPSQGARTPVLVSGYVSVSGGTVLGGLVTITGVAKYNETLTADTTRLTTEPAGADTGALSYQWKRGGVDIVGANSATYTLAAADIGQTITVTVTAANCAGEVTSAPVPPIAKADGPAAPVAPTMASKTTTSVTLEIIPGAEYRLGTTGAWQTSPTFDGLNPNTGYVFFARIAETATHEASITSDGTTVTTNDQTLPYTVEYYYDGVIDNSLTETKSVSAASPIVTSASITDNLKAGYKADTPQYVPALPTTITLTENVIRVYYVAVLWTVTFDLAGGTRTGGGELTQTIPLGGAAIAPIATRSGYTFIGWDKTFDNVTSDITVTAQWSAISYTVTYKANGGTGVDVTSIVVYDQEYEVAGNSFTPPTGYNFGGWNTVANGTGTAYAPGDKITIKDDVTLYAQWVPENNLKITYNANTGTGTMADQTVTYDSNVTLTANAFSKSGYVFDVGKPKADGTGTGYANSATFKYEVDGDLTLYAQWEPKYDLKIIYNANTGTGTMADQTVTYDSNVTLTANAFSKTGYVFNAWNTQADGTGTAYADSETFKYEIDGDLTLYAQWMPENSLKITYNANTGTGTMADQTVTYDSNVTLTANAFSKTGYVFTGWNTAANGSGTAYANSETFKYEINGDLTLYAQWTPKNDLKIIYNANTGTGTMADQTVTYDSDVTLTANAFIKTGYVFNGWNTQADGTGTGYANSATFTYQIDGDLTLYAQWAPKNDLRIIYNANTGTGTMADQTVTYDSQITLTANAFSKTGYVFNGWNTAADGIGTAYANTSTFKYEIDGDLTLYAQWMPETSLKITYNANTGTGTMADQTVTYDSDVTLAANAFSKTGYVFNGWNTAANGSGTAYANSATFKYEIDGDLTLYAQWTPDPHIVTYRANGGAGADVIVIVVYDEVYRLAGNTFTPPTGYTFDGWNTTANGTGIAYAPGIDITIKGDITLYAQWESTPYTITYMNLQGASNSNPAGFDVEDLVITLVAPGNRLGYTFEGWTLTDADGAPVTEITTVGNVTLWANWKIISYTVNFDLAGGTRTGGGELVQTIPYGGSATAPIATRDGYTFVGWDKAFDNVTSDMTVTALWSAITYTVNFDLAGGTRTGGGALEQIVPEGGAATAPIAIRDGYTFVGWDKAFDNVTSDMTVTALWSAITYTVNFDLAGGTRTGGGALEQIVPQGGAATAPIAIRDGYTFVGWDKAFDNVTSDMTVTALWSAITYTVNFDLAGGTRTGGGALEQIVPQGGAATAPIATRNGYTFVGWDKTFDNVTSDITVTAQWSVISYTVKFDSDGGTPVADAYVDYLGKVAQPDPNPTKDGYTFIGWSIDEALYDFNTPVTGNLTLKAVWKLTTDVIPVTSIKIDAPAQVTVLRMSKYTFTVTLNPGATSDGIIWSVTPAGFATVNPTTGEIITQNKTGTVLLTATDIASGLSSSIVLRII